MSPHGGTHGIGTDDANIYPAREAPPVEPKCRVIEMIVVEVGQDGNALAPSRVDLAENMLADSLTHLRITAERRQLRNDNGVG